MNKWKKFFNHMLNVHGVKDIRQMDIHTAEPLVPELRLVEWENPIEELNRYESPGTDQIPAELIKAGGEMLRSEVLKLIRFIDGLPQQWKESIIVPIYKKGDKTDCNNYPGVSLSSNAYKILSNILLARLTPYVSESTGG
jgi:hypothetical protein